MLLRKTRAWVRRCRFKLLRTLGLAGGVWKDGLSDEMRFWSAALREPAVKWDAEAYRFRTDPNAALQPELTSLLKDAGTHVRILDVGAGPLTTLGKVWPGHTLEIVAVDPLAAEYDRLLEDIRLVPPVRTIAAEGESLATQFAAESFDLAYSSNALDHSRDPLLVIRQMLTVTKPGCWIYLWHFAAEGLTEGYQGLHQWDFDVRGRDFFIGDGKKQSSLGKELSSEADLEVEETRAYGKRVVIAKLHKKARV